MSFKRISSVVVPFGFFSGRFVCSNLKDCVCLHTCEYIWIPTSGSMYKNICVCIHICIYTPENKPYICPDHWVRLSFEKRGHCDDCEVPYNLLICFLSCGDSFVLCRMNNIRCITGCSRGALRFLLTLAAGCLPHLGLLLSGSPMIWENKNVYVIPGALTPWWKFKTWDVIRSLFKVLHWWLFLFAQVWV